MDLQTVLNRAPVVVVADDDWLNRDLLETFLVNAGCEVTALKDGTQALQTIMELEPDLAIVDIRMPGLDGLTVCRRVKNNPRTRFIPIIVVTALDSQDEELKAIASGADDFITKPFNSLILLTRVRSLLRLKSLHDELESRNKLLRQVLIRYVDHEIADIILTDPKKHLKLGGETRQVTVLFADLRDFTRFSAQHPAPKVVEILNLVFNELVEIVFNHNGTFDKFLGDAIMAFFGAPISGDDDAHRALQAAVEMQRCFGGLQKREDNGILQSLGLGVGIHSGEVTVGNIGSERRMDYTVIGDNVNIARRLQELARPGEILISEAVLKLVPKVQVQRLGTQALPGRSDPITVYSLESL